MAESAAKKNLAPVESAAVPPGKSSGPLSDKLGLALVLLVTLNVAGLAGMGFFVNKLWHSVHKLEIAPKAAAPRDEHDISPLGKDLQPAKLGVLYGMESFLVNIPSEQGTKFLQLQMEFELSEPTLEDEITQKKAVIRDAIIVQLSSKTFQQLRGARAMKGLQKDLIAAVNQFLTSGKVKEIYFTQFHFN